ncbi:hypothetical protein RZP48_26250, partial [Enterobacter asburiae]
GPVKLTIARTSELSHRRTLLLSHYNTGAHNKDYVKFNGKIIINQYLKYRTSPFLPQTSLW